MPLSLDAPVCLACHRTMRCIKTGVAVLQVFNEPRPVTAENEPYIVQPADLFECMSCGRQALSGWNRGVGAWESEFEKEMERWRNQPADLRLWWS